MHYFSLKYSRYFFFPSNIHVISFFLQIFMLFLNIYMYLYKYKHTCEKITHIFQRVLFVKVTHYFIFFAIRRSLKHFGQWNCQLIPYVWKANRWRHTRWFSLNVLMTSGSLHLTMSRLTQIPIHLLIATEYTS